MSDDKRTSEGGEAAAADGAAWVGRVFMIDSCGYGNQGPVDPVTGLNYHVTLDFEDSTRWSCNVSEATYRWAKGLMDAEDNGSGPRWFGWYSMPIALQRAFLADPPNDEDDHDE